MSFKADSPTKGFTPVSIDDFIDRSAILGRGCFTFITGETDNNNDYEIK